MPADGAEHGRWPLRLAIAGGFAVLLGLLSWLLRVPALFPAVGPSLLMLVHPSPAPLPRPLTVLLGHLVGALAGAAALTACGLWGEPAALSAGFTPAYLLSGTLAIMVVTVSAECEVLHHPPAAATTLLVSLGAMTRPAQLAGLGLGIVLVWLLAIGLSRTSRRTALAPAESQDRQSTT
jgi:hypothetical protein